MYFSQSGSINLIPGMGFPCDLWTAVHPYCVFTCQPLRGGEEWNWGWDGRKGEGRMKEYSIVSSSNKKTHSNHSDAASVIK